MNRKICVNDTDFATLEDIKLIPYNQFYSFTCNNNNVYGFNIISLYSLISKSNTGIINRNQNNIKLNLRNNTLNPYTREKIEDKIIEHFFKYLLLAKINNIEYEWVSLCKKLPYLFFTIKLSTKKSNTKNSYTYANINMEEGNASPLNFYYHRRIKSYG